MMDKYVSHSNDVGPGNICMSRLKVVRQCAAGLANDRDVVDHPVLDEFVIFKCSLSVRGVFRDPLGGFKDIEQALAVVSTAGALL